VKTTEKFQNNLRHFRLNRAQNRGNKSTYSSSRSPNAKPRTSLKNYARLEQRVSDSEDTRGARTHFDVAAAELVVAAKAGEDPGVPALPREAAKGVSRHGLAHHDRDPVGVALGGLRRRSRSLRGLLVRGGGGSWDEGARLLLMVAVGGGAHGETGGRCGGSDRKQATAT